MNIQAVGVADADNVAPLIAKFRVELLGYKNIQLEENLESAKEEFEDYLSFIIEEMETRNREKKKRFAWITDILLFFIAFTQIAPVIYGLLTGRYSTFQIWHIIVIASFLLIGSVIIIKKG